MRKLREVIKSTGGLAIAFSGGLDSSFLAAVAKEELDERAIAVTALSPTYPQREQTDAAATAAKGLWRVVSLGAAGAVGDTCTIERIQ